MYTDPEYEDWAEAVFMQEDAQNPSPLGIAMSQKQSGQVIWFARSGEVSETSEPLSVTPRGENPEVD